MASYSQVEQVEVIRVLLPFIGQTRWRSYKPDFQTADTNNNQLRLSYGPGIVGDGIFAAAYQRLTVFGTLHADHTDGHRLTPLFPCKMDSLLCQVN
jgi:hypothetical protein